MKARKSVTALSVSGAGSCLASRRGMSAKSAAPWVTDLKGLPSNDGAEVTQKLSIGSASIFFERREVVFETSPCARRARCVEAAQRKQRVAALEIAVDSFLQPGAEIVPNLGV